MSIYGANWGIIGHEWAVDLLSRRMSTGRSSHATLITGPKGVGKNTLALRLTQVANCLNASTPCGECRPCTLIERYIHPDIHRVDREGQSIKIERVRELQHNLNLRPIEARYRVALIEGFNPRYPQVADALLKTLEEPPSYVQIIVIADHIDSVPATIVSRSQTISLRPVPIGQIESALLPSYTSDSDQAMTLAHLSGGRPGWAIQAIQDPSALEARHQTITDILNVLQGNRAARFKYAETIYKKHQKDRDKLYQELELWLGWWRDVLLLSEGSRAALTNIDYTDTLSDIAGQVAPNEAYQAIKAVHATADNIHKNANIRLSLDLMLLAMPYTT